MISIQLGADVEQLQSLYGMFAMLAVIIADTLWHFLSIFSRELQFGCSREFERDVKSNVNYSISPKTRIVSNLEIWTDR